MRRMIHPAHVVAFVGFFGLVMAIGLLLKDYATQASLQQVRAAVQQGAEYDAQTAADTELEGIEMPSWDRWGWTLTGGRTDQLEDRRDALTGFYRGAEGQIAYTVVAGTGDVNNGEGSREVVRTPPQGKTSLTIGGTETVLSVKRKVGERTVVLTAWPVSDQLLADMQDMALRVDF